MAETSGITTHSGCYVGVVWLAAAKAASPTQMHGPEVLRLPESHRITPCWLYA